MQLLSCWDTRRDFSGSKHQIVLYVCLNKALVHGEYSSKALISVYVWCWGHHVYAASMKCARELSAWITVDWLDCEKCASSHPFTRKYKWHSGELNRNYTTSDCSAGHTLPSAGWEFPQSLLRFLNWMSNPGFSWRRCWVRHAACFVDADDGGWWLLRKLSLIRLPPGSQPIFSRLVNMDPVACIHYDEDVPGV